MGTSYMITRPALTVAFISYGCLAMHQPDALHKAIKDCNIAQRQEELTHLNLAGQSQNKTDTDGNTPINLSVQKLKAAMQHAEQSAQTIKRRVHHYAPLFLGVSYIALFGRRIVQTLRTSSMHKKPWVAFKAISPVIAWFLIPKAIKRPIKNCIGFFAEKILNFRARRTVKHRNTLCSLLLNADNNPIDATIANSRGKSCFHILDDAIELYNNYESRGLGKYIHSMRAKHRTMLISLQEAIDKHAKTQRPVTSLHPDNRERQLPNTKANPAPQVTPAMPIHDLQYPELLLQQQAQQTAAAAPQGQANQAASYQRLYPII